MNKPMLGLVLGGALGALDGMTAMFSAPETKPQIMGIIAGSTGKGLVAGVLIGLIARKINNLTASVILGFVVAAIIALPFALFGFMLNAKPDYVESLWKTELGQKMSIFAIIAQVIGAAVIRKIVNIKV